MSCGGRKRMCTGEGENDGVVVGRWEWMNPEVLALIFVRLPAEERLKTVAMVCRAWLEAVAGPYCWTEIDIEPWCRRCNRPDLVDSVVRKLVRRSKCTFRRVSAYKLGDTAFSYIANCGRCLKVLQIPMSSVTDKVVEKHAELLANITVLDISYCLTITFKGVEAFGKHCKSLAHLKRNMPPPEWEKPALAEASKVNDTEAMIIADTMTGLRHLELCFGRFGDDGLNSILTKCKKLAYLDIQGCWNVEFKGDLEDRCEQLTFFRNPYHDYYMDGLSSSESDGSGADVSVESSSSDSD
ncbi:F-box protein [Actinidia chinensis var. chinensis]|uniref:F-box protein n=1 Tax=Actinidia chinensis var. chinensis TaxID=1590841 RepID=A0A2R6RSJ4_ACTCC|nr:F-box protein [Actinidia chinensis var. chinensis]